MFRLSSSSLLRIHRTTSALRCASTIAIGYGSQTGTGMTFAAMLAQDAGAHGVTAKLDEANTVDLGAVSEDPDAALILIMATCGEGEPTDNAASMYNTLMAMVPGSPEAEPLVGTPFAVFGLGNSTAYPDRYNVVARNVHTKLVDLGAAPLLDLGLGDDSGAVPGRFIDDDFDDWADELWPALDAASGASPASPGADSASVKDDVCIRVFSEEEGQALRSEWDSMLASKQASEEASQISYSTPVQLAVKDNWELQGPDSARSTRHISLDLTGSNLSYATGDHLAVFPRNSDAQIATLFGALDIDPDAYIMIDKAESSPNAPLLHGDLVSAPLKAAEVMGWRKDISAPPTSSVVRALARAAPSDADKAFLESISASTEPVLPTLAEAIAGAPSLRDSLSLAQLLSIAPPIKPRFYSISSAAEEDPATLDLTVSVVPQGLCSNYIAGLIPDQDSVSAFVRDSGFRLPEDPSTPIILVGAGAGIAPLRGFVRARAVAQAAGAALGPAHLYFGCEAPGLDDLYASDMVAAVDAGILSSYNPAYNLCPGPNGERYVQHILAQASDTIADTLARGGTIYVCGKESTIGVGVKDVVADVIGHSALDRILDENTQFVQDVFS